MIVGIYGMNLTICRNCVRPTAIPDPRNRSIDAYLFYRFRKANGFQEDTLPCVAYSPIAPRISSNSMRFIGLIFVTIL
jgi:hypothetical protein